MNSVSLERVAAIDVAREMNAVVVAGATGAEKMPEGKEQRVENCGKIVDRLRAAGFSLSDIFLDPLVFPVSVDPNNGLYVLEAIRDLRASLGSEIHFAPGLSNISFGMPIRRIS